VFKDDRDGPRHVWQVAQAAQRRWRTPADRLGGKPYRPGTLEHVAAELDAMGAWTFVPTKDVLAVELVKPSDTLSHYAHRHYGDASLWPFIFEANIDTLDDPDEIFPGQEIRIPRRPDERVQTT
jgi:nucleoid-associated protein YgaU